MIAYSVEVFRSFIDYVFLILFSKGPLCLPKALFTRFRSFIVLFLIQVLFLFFTLILSWFKIPLPVLSSYAHKPHKRCWRQEWLWGNWGQCLGKVQERLHGTQCAWTGQASTAEERHLLRLKGRRRRRRSEVIVSFACPMFLLWTYCVSWRIRK